MASALAELTADLQSQAESDDQGFPLGHLPPVLAPLPDAAAAAETAVTGIGHGGSTTLVPLPAGWQAAAPPAEAFEWNAGLQSSGMNPTGSQRHCDAASIAAAQQAAALSGNLRQTSSSDASQRNISLAQSKGSDGAGTAQKVRAGFRRHITVLAKTVDRYACLTHQWVVAGHVDVFSHCSMTTLGVEPCAHPL